MYKTNVFKQYICRHLNSSNYTTQRSIFLKYEKTEKKNPKLPTFHNLNRAISDINSNNISILE